MILLFVFRNVLYFPMFCVFLVISKYRIIANVEMEEYGGHGSEKVVDGYISNVALTLVVMLYILLIVDCTVFYDNLTGNPIPSLFAKGYSRLDLARYTVTFLLICSYVFVAEFSSLLHSAICMVLSMLITGSYIYYMPYYRKLANFWYSTAFVILAISALGQFLGYFLNDTTCTLLFSVVLPLPLAYIVWLGLDYRRYVALST